ncbi:MAG TPA: kelch repeat-containing protein [Pseudolabrys sp.]|nr:kelch repeat-containing protein [Pseudolabrys sp.]
MKTLSGGLLAALATIVLLQAAPASAQEGKWRFAKPLPQPLGEIVGAVVDNKWYVMGGYDGANVQPQGIVTQYDPASDSWTMKKNMLVPAHHAAAVALNGKIYVFGGFVGRPGAKGWGPIANALEYDPANDSWKELAPMPTPRGSAQAVTVDGKIYVIGGAHANLPGKPSEPLWIGVPQIVTGTVEEYDPATNTWRSRAPMPTGRNHFYAGVVDGKIYAINGRLGNSFVTASDVTDLVEQYDPKTDQWRYMGRAPTRRGDVSGDVHNGKLYVTGGEYENPDGKITFWAFQAFDPKTNTWQILPHIPIARHGFAATFIGNDFHAAGGSFQSDGMPGIISQMPSHEVYTVAK